MRSPYIVLLFALLWLTEARAGNTVVSGKDSAGVSHNFYVVTDGAGNYYPGQVICDQSAAAQCAGVTGGFALQSDATSMGGTAISSTCVNGGGGVGSGNCPTVNILNSASQNFGAALTPAATSAGTPIGFSDGTSMRPGEVTAASTAPTATQRSLVVAVSPNSGIADGTTNTSINGSKVQCLAATAYNTNSYTNNQINPVNCDLNGNIFTSNNLSRIAGTAVASGNGVSGAGVQRVAIVSDNTAFAVNAAAASAVNVTPTDCSIALTTGGTAQNIITAGATLHGFSIANIDTAAGSGEPVWMSFTGTAVASATASYPLAAPTATTFAGLSSYTTPLGFGTNANVSVIAATTGHKISCTKW